MNTSYDTTPLAILTACEHLAEIGEYINNHTISIELEDGLTIHVRSDAKTRVVVLDGNVVFDATEDYDGNVLVDTFEDGAWIDTIFAEFDTLTTRTKRS